jgi:ATP-dependent helicase YprA (DUF1998 family)
LIADYPDLVSLSSFTPAVRDWFQRSFEEPTSAQEQAWPAIARGENVLLSAPTGSGKTLAAFLWALDRFVAQPAPGEDRRTRLIYVSPLKALSYDIERNLRAPLRGIGADVRVGIRTGDTPQKERQQMLRRPPDILITTPESLYLMLTSRAREFLTGAEAVIVDEVHAVARTKRGAHLALTLERLEHQTEGPLQRIGLSATQRPLEEVARFLVGPSRQCTIIDTGQRKPLDLQIRVPVDDMREPDAQADLSEVADGVGATRRSIWPAIYPELLELVKEHRSTILFVNNRRSAERLALRLNELAEDEIARAHHGSLAREERLVVEDLLKSGQLPCLVATSSLELGIDMGAVDLVVGHRGAAANRPRRTRAERGRQGADLPQVPRGPARGDGRREAYARGRDRADRRAAQPARRPGAAHRLDVRLARGMAGRRASRARPAHLLVRRAHPPPARQRARHARRPVSLGGVLGAASAHRLGSRARHDPPASRSAAARGHERGHDPGPRAVRGAPA